MEAITLPIFNTQGKEVDSIKLDAKVFDGDVNKDAIHQAVVAYMANQRRGLASTKTRGEVSGGGRKPWKQKGTGRARVGSTRSPLWRHGGVVFGPHPRDFSVPLPKKIKDLALKSSLNAKVKENNFIILDEMKLESPKTKEAVKVISNFKFELKRKKGRRNILLLLDKTEEPLKLAMRNLSFLDLGTAIGTHAYEVLSHRRLILTKDALHSLTIRLKNLKTYAR